MILAFASLNYYIFLGLPLYLEKPGILQVRKKKPGILTIFTCSVVKFRFDTKNLSINKIFSSSSKNIFIKKHIKSSFIVSFQCFYTI